jgi:hypothetical protein
MHVPDTSTQNPSVLDFHTPPSAPFTGVSESSRRGGAESLIAGLGCTHPDSNRRAELLQKELAWMAANRADAKDAVGSKVNYWSL